MERKNNWIQLKYVLNCGSSERSKRGDGTRCASCNRAYRKKWRQENKIRNAEYERQRYDLNKEKINQNRREHYPIIAEKDRQRSRDWVKNNPEKNNEKGKRWVKNNPKKHNENVRSWQKRNPDKVREYRRKRRVRKKEAEGGHTLEEWQLLLDYYDHKCLCCGILANDTLECFLT